MPLFVVIFAVIISAIGFIAVLSDRSLFGHGYSFAVYGKKHKPIMPSISEEASDTVNVSLKKPLSGTLGGWLPFQGLPSP